MPFGASNTSGLHPRGSHGKRVLCMCSWGDCAAGGVQVVIVVVVVTVVVGIVASAAVVPLAVVAVCVIVSARSVCLDSDSQVNMQFIPQNLVGQPFASYCTSGGICWGHRPR